jgi:hypothetical protein
MAWLEPAAVLVAVVGIRVLVVLEQLGRVTLDLQVVEQVVILAALVEVLEVPDLFQAILQLAVLELRHR